jgi:hypothetical protein
MDYVNNKAIKRLLFDMVAIVDLYHLISTGRNEGGFV